MLGKAALQSEAKLSGGSFGGAGRILAKLNRMLGTSTCRGGAGDGDGALTQWPARASPPTQRHGSLHRAKQGNRSPARGEVFGDKRAEMELAARGLDGQAASEPDSTPSRRLWGRSPRWYHICQPSMALEAQWR